MSFVVVAYPKISQSDFDWIQAVREEYDLRQFSVVQSHITFVFPTQKLSRESLIEHVRAKLSKVKAFEINLAPPVVQFRDYGVYLLRVGQVLKSLQLLYVN
jgi:hypothetical protein